MKQPNFLQRNAGLSMIEILVSLTIVAFGLLGLLGLQARALSFQKDSFDRRVVAEMVAQLAERLRANHRGLKDGVYDYDLGVAAATPTVIPVCATQTACTQAEVAVRDVNQWAAELRRRIPVSAAHLQWNAAAGEHLLVSVAWHEPQSNPGMTLAGADPLCETINGRLGAGIPRNYRCYETSIYP